MTKIYKSARSLNEAGYTKLSRIFEKINMLIYSNSVSCSCRIGKGTEFMHHGMGTTIHSKAVIGQNCKIFQNVTLGSKWSEGVCHDEAPIIGDNVIIGAGAVVLGNIHIGNNVIIGANSVVTHDIPDNSVAVGMPAKVIKTRK